MTRGPALTIKRVREAPAPGDGTRVLVDRIWPRGMTKDRAAADHWLKEIAPSTELRKWFGHDPERWEEFRKKYRAELAANDEAVDRLMELAVAGPVTLIFDARDGEHNQAVVLAEYAGERLKRRKG